MAFTPEQIEHATNQQWTAARDPSRHVRLVAGPGTGKSHTIEKRIAHLLNGGVDARNVYVISFTRATCGELRGRIQSFCQGQACAASASQVPISTMHSLALRILRRANLLTAYPSTPILLDDWEQRAIYDNELASSLHCPPGRAAEIRLAYDAQWQTLDPAHIDQAGITPEERRGFQAFHRSRTHLYSCVLPGEVIHKCVEAFRMRNLLVDSLPPIEHLIVDEYQDLNACDQEFIRQLCSHRNAVLFVAGDDDQSIYSFRHANPDGIVRFEEFYPQAVTHVLSDCFRCAPAILEPATRLIENNPNRLGKELTALYGNAAPPVPGQLCVWRFASANDEARAIAQSCRALIDAGMQGRENDLVILLSNRRMQLETLERALRAEGLPFDQPRGASLQNDFSALRAVYALLRIARDQETEDEDYPSYRDLLEVLSGVGTATAKAVGDGCIQNNQNFRELFYLQTFPAWLNGRSRRAVERVAAARTIAGAWRAADTIEARAREIQQVLSGQVFISEPHTTNAIGQWTALVEGLPPDMTLDELYQLLMADTESDQQAVLDSVAERLGMETEEGENEAQAKIRILTMHGAKGLSGAVVFIPSAEQMIIPNAKALRATGLLIEQRRLFYVSLTRAKACCIISHVAQRTGADAQMLAQRATVQMPRSQFLDEAGVPSVVRRGGLSAEEAAAIITEVSNL